MTAYVPPTRAEVMATFRSLGDDTGELIRCCSHAVFLPYTARGRREAMERFVWEHKGHVMGDGK